MENKWLTYAKQLHALATSGLEFTPGDYDRDRYHEIQAIASSMLADISTQPIQKIDELLLNAVDGYQTPKVDVRAAVINDNKILLVQEKTDQRWALPGGYADIGFSAAENAEKEVREEAGIWVQAHQLYALRHKAKGEYRQDIRDFYKVFFLCEINNDSPAVNAGSEVLDAKYFSLDQLPELSLGRTVESDLRAAFEYSKRGNTSTYFDNGDYILGK